MERNAPTGQRLEQLEEQKTAAMASIMEYMLAKGTATSTEDFLDRYVEILDMVMEGYVYMDSIDWIGKQSEVREVAMGVKKGVKKNS